MKIVITGARGLLGSVLCRELGSEVIGLSREQLDITSAEAVRRTLDEIRPDALINAAAATQVDQAEDEPRMHRIINSDAVANLADACAALNCRLVHVSTDYVFGGDVDRTQPYREEDEPEPQGTYGRMKRAGERHAARCTEHLIVRTCGLYGRVGRWGKTPNFVERILRLATRGGRIRVVDDQHCTPSYATHVARAIGHLVQQRASGIFHVVNTGETTWFDFAQTILRLAGVKAQIDPISTEDYGARARRPSYSVLDTSKYHATGGPPMPTWQEALEEYFASRESR